jgi:hypothetical protein
VQETLAVEVFPVAHNRWIAVIDAPAGPFSTEARTSEAVIVEVEAAMREVLGEPVPAYRLIAPDGRDWNDDIAREQTAGLGG